MPTGIELLRCGVGGALAGVASLFPGISGGTMIVAIGAYPRLVRSMAELSALKFRAGSLTALGVAMGAAFMAIFFAAGVARDAFARWPVESLAALLGLTLGGVPVLARMAPVRGKPFAVAAVAGLSVALLPLVLEQSAVAVAEPSTLAFLGAGFVSAMVMPVPGASGTYLLLLMGMYLPYLDAADRVGDALRGVGAMLPALSGIAPFIAGAALGLGVASRVLHHCLETYRQATLGALFGLLAGAAAGLWPFQTADGVRYLPAGGAARDALIPVACGFTLTALIGRTSSTS